MTIKEIAKVKGLGQIKAMELLAAIELGKRSMRQTIPMNLKDDKEVEKLIKPYIKAEQKVQYHLVLINDRKELLATSEMETENGTLPDLKKIIKLVLEAGAAEIALCRNAIKLPVSFQNEEKAYIIQLDAAASMLQINMRGLLIIS
ncbi:MAG TPA: JAB domain-containing protein [Mucilaginibacter sp.]|jgi:DNA repair protein RadC|nr:JAB domain-containing protein [Mucilaginibacter sp.]